MVFPSSRTTQTAIQGGRDAGSGPATSNDSYAGGLLILLLVVASLAAATLTLWKSHIFPSLKIPHSAFVDATGSMTLAEICCGSAKANFRAGAGASFRSGGLGEVLWLEVSPPAEPGYLIIHSPLDHIALVRHDGRGNVIGESVSGDMEPVTEREIITSFFAFLLTERDLDGPIYLRVRNHETYGASLKFVALPEFESYRETTELIHLVAMAIVVFMMAYNLLLSVLIRDAAFLLNALFAGGLLTVNLAATGFGNAFVWSGYEPWSNDVLAHAIAFNLVAFCLFAYVFLTDSPLRRAFSNYIFATIAVAISGLVLRDLGFVQLSRFVALAALVGALAVISVTSIVGTLRGDPRARILLIAEGSVLLPGTILFLVQFTLGRDLLIPPQHIIDVVLVLEALFFSLALAYRLRIAQAEADDALELATRTRREASARILEGIDADRKRIASDLHDTAGQGLLVVSNQLASVSKSRDMPAKIRSDLSEIASYSKHIIGDIRRISHDLHPSIIEHLGWENAVQALFTNMEGVAGIKCDVRIDADCLKFDADRQLQLYRVLQEATNNIVQHAQATACDVRIERQEETIRVRIADNGIGMPSQSRATGDVTSMGLEVMRQRVENLRGSFELSSVSAADTIPACRSTGTTIDIVLPWQREMPKRAAQ